MKTFLETLNESTNLIAIAAVAVGALLVSKGHSDAGLIIGGFAILKADANTKKNQENQSK
jgi:hypothetical protein